MASIEPVFQILYTSRLAPGCDAIVVKGIAATARRHNPAHAITGALLFDGEHFCQLIEGAESQVQELMRRIAQDARHTDVRTLFSGRSAAGRRSSRWRSGYCEPASFEVFEGHAGEIAVPAIEAFVGLMKLADLE